MANKQRKITISKDELFKQIDAMTYKAMEAHPEQQDARARNAVSSDSKENLDSGLLKRYVEKRDAKLRGFWRRFIMNQQKETVAANNEIQGAECFIYELSLPEEFNDACLQPMATMIHNYLIWGALYDWYSKMGFTAQARAFKDDLDDVEDELADTFRGSSYARMPVQPFGPFA